MQGAHPTGTHACEATDTPTTANAHTHTHTTPARHATPRHVLAAAALASCPGQAALPPATPAALAAPAAPAAVGGRPVQGRAPQLCCRELSVTTQLRGSVQCLLGPHFRIGTDSILSAPAALHTAFKGGTSGHAAARLLVHPAAKPLRSTHCPCHPHLLRLMLLPRALPPMLPLMLSSRRSFASSLTAVRGGREGEGQGSKDHLSLIYL